MYTSVKPLKPATDRQNTPIDLRDYWTMRAGGAVGQVARSAGIGVVSTAGEEDVLGAGGGCAGGEEGEEK